MLSNLYLIISIPGIGIMLFINTVSSSHFEINEDPYVRGYFNIACFSIGIGPIV